MKTDVKTSRIMTPKSTILFRAMNKKAVILSRAMYKKAVILSRVADIKGTILDCAMDATAALALAKKSANLVWTVEKTVPDIRWPRPEVRTSAFCNISTRLTPPVSSD